MPGKPAGVSLDIRKKYIFRILTGNGLTTPKYLSPKFPTPDFVHRAGRGSRPFFEIGLRVV